MAASIPLRTCLLSLALSVGAWVYVLCLPGLVLICALLWGDDGAFAGSFIAVGLLLPLLVLAVGLTASGGLLMLAYYGLCYPASGPKQPVVMRCGLYLLVAFAFCAGLPWLLSR